MNNHLPFFNWSLRKLLLSESETFNRAAIKILYTILLFALVKIFVVIFTAWYYQQNFQLGRAIAALFFYSLLLKLLLTNKGYVRPLTHVMLWGGIALITTNIFIAAKAINIATLQFVFMAMVSSFYLLNRKYGIFYSVATSIPVLIFLFTSETGSQALSAGQLASPGSLIIVVLNFMTLIIAHYLYHGAFSANIAEKESLNVQLKAAVEEANRQAQSKLDFLSTMSHELRTPLNSVIGMTDLLMEDPHSEAQKENLGILNFSAKSLYRLINDVLDFNKVDLDKLHLENINVNLYDLMHSICSALELHAKEKGLQLLTDVDETLRNRYVLTDPTRIAQIIYNLVGNGIKFTKHGNVTLSLKVLSKNEDELKVRFSVTDTGIGISENQQRFIFEPFVQASINIARNFGGTGLGLSIVKRLLPLFGSEIQLESIPDKGSNFFFDIVFRQQQTIMATGSGVMEAGYDLTGLRVLVAEDNPMNIILIKKLCNKWRIIPTIAENGVEAVKKFRTGTYDVILMDIHMPEMNGYEAAREIRAMDHPASIVPIIALTATVSPEMAIKLKEAGLNDYVHKPFNAKELYLKLKTIAEAVVS